jgi:UDP-N-acetylmuramoylalanine--D-glutamate ligase
LAEALCRHAHAVVLTGATASKIQAALDICPAFASSDLCVQTADTLEQAVRTARALAEVGGCVLLSPACASFDAFRNFAERGNAFKRIVLSLDTEN